MPKGIMGNRGSWSLIETLGISATQRETSQTNLFMPSLFLLVNTVNLNQSTPNSFYPQYQSALSRTLLRFCGTTFVETAVYIRSSKTWTNFQLGLFFRLLQLWAGNRLSQLNNQFSTILIIQTGTDTSEILCIV